MAFKYGQMVQNMKDSGKLIWLKVLEDSFWLMEMFTKEIGLMIKRMERVSTFMPKELLTKVAGLKTSKKAQEEKSGQMAHTTKELTSKERSMDKASFSGLTEPSIMDSGKTTKCTDQENSNGLMVEHTKENMPMIRSMDRGFTHGLMEECIKVDFIMESSTEKVCIDRRQDKKFTVSGKEARKVKYVSPMMNFWHRRIMFE